MNNRLPPRWLVVGLMMFPQMVETIYSPVLTHIATEFGVSEGQASQTLSVYFLAFAAGVVCWGRLCDLIGRRPAMLAGLLTYGAGTGHRGLRRRRGLRGDPDHAARQLSGQRSGAGLSVMGIALSLSPVLGLVSGGLLADGLGYLGVFGALLALAIGLLLMACWQLPETRPATTQRVALWPLACRMVRDTGLWRSAALVALFNTMLFGYYSLAPFLFASLGLSAGEFGYSGIVLASGSSWLVWASQTSLWFLLPMTGVMVAFGLAIPNVLSQALLAYREVAGSAGALFGLGYYLLLSLGLAVAASLQDLGLLLGGCGLLAVCCCWRRST